MILSKLKPDIVFDNTNLAVSFFDSGDICQINCKDVMINQFIGNKKEGSANNIWLRIYNEGEIKAYPLMGIESSSTVQKSKNSLKFFGEHEGVKYSVVFNLSDSCWFYTVTLEGERKTVDLVYGQDLGLADRRAVLGNELYLSQYLGNTVFEADNGYCICSRQNQKQSTGFPYIQQGMLKGKSVCYSTDGMQFFTLEYKFTHEPKALKGNLENKNLQFECSYTALQSEKIILNSKKELVFYAICKPTHTDAIDRLEYKDEIDKAYQKINDEEYVDLPQVKLKKEFSKAYTSPQFSEGQIDKFFPNRHLQEYKDGCLHSFFSQGHSHVVLAQKEFEVQRPHGNIITTALDTQKINSNLLCSTNYIYGLFASQTVVGNTSMHKFLCTSRGLLNILKNTGQRIYVKIDEKFRILTMPAAYEMGLNYSKWYYVIGEDVLIITSFAVKDSPEIVLEVQSSCNKEYEFIITNQLALGDNEFANDIENEKTENGFRFKPVYECFKDSPYNNLSYDLNISGVDFTSSDDRIFFEDEQAQNKALFTIQTKETSIFTINIKGNLDEEAYRISNYDFENEKSLYLDFYDNLLSGIKLKLKNSTEIDKLNETLYWYAHNAMVHFAVPHGLEQPGGAAWGTRDVSQGPMEFFLFTQNYKLARATLLNLFSHQSKITGEWHQWFMFDKYKMSAGECHGDVVFWPLKCVADYIKSSGDKTILAEKLPYLLDDNSKEESLSEHIKTAVKAIEARFLEGTHLLSYAGGDWDDTLQPANKDLKERLVSSWTQALSYQALSALSDIFKDVDEEFYTVLQKMSENIKQDFIKYCIFDNIPAGFVFLDNSGELKPMLHPKDDKTGIHYRLLPMIRSIISELSDKEQSNKNMQIIEEHLKFPDGVRLMNKPTKYNGGVSKLFVRAEQAANIGREIGLQYVHAHIRYIEALCKMGMSEKAWEALFVINPIGIKDVVENAVSRQANLYFSSSDGEFYDRYDFYDNFSKLKDGTVNVKGGWRLYSSGPGIYLNQLISNVMGIRFLGENIIIDPVIPKSLDGLEFELNYQGQKLEFKFSVKKENYSSVKAVIGTEELSFTPKKNPYRHNGISVKADEIISKGNKIQIVLK